MTKPEHTIPFNMEHARAGAPFCCANGQDVEILKWDRKHEFCIVGIANDDLAIRTWRDDGTYCDVHSKAFKLVMTPLGMLDGNPVFAGDILEDDEQFGMGTFTVGPTMRQGHFSHCKWPEPEPAPAPAKVYPETRMFGLDLHHIYANNGGSAVAVANAALRHAVDSGQVMLPGGEMSDEVILNAFKKFGLLYTGEHRNRIIASVKSLLVTEPEVDEMKADLARSEKELCTAENTLEDAGYRRNKDGGWEPPVGQLHKDSCFLGIVNVGHISGNKNVIDYVSNCISLLEASQKREVAIANTMREACEAALATLAVPAGLQVYQNDVVMAAVRLIGNIDATAIIAGVTGQPSATSDPYRAAANAMRQACSDVLEQLNDRHLFKRSDTVAAARLVIDNIDVNAVLSGVKS